MTTRTNTAVWLEKYQRWQIKVQKDGERKTFTCSTPGRKGQIDCNKRADKWLSDGVAVALRVNEVFVAWIEELKLSTSRSHWGMYEKFGKLYICPAIGSRKMDSISEQDLQKIILSCAKRGMRGSPLAHKTLVGIRSCIAALIKYGRKCRQTSLHLEDLYIPKNAKRGKRVILQPKSLIVLLSNETTLWRDRQQPDILIHAYRFAVSTGLRPGEVLELHHCDISQNMVTISGSYNYYGEHTDGKNENAKRSFVLNDIALQAIKDQRKLLLRLGIRSDYLFCDKQGQQINQKQYHAAWSRYRDFHGLEATTPYGLRHTFASFIKSLPDDVLKATLGHSYSFDTRGTYTHEIDGDKERNAELISAALKQLIS